MPVFYSVVLCAWKMATMREGVVGREAHKNYSNNWEEIDLTGLKDLSIKSTHGYSHQINDRSLKS